ncbi:hypothetical protein ACF1BP_21605 [Streptomyces sp. NPDC014735]|uniref:hypothetical protein n=1 Tax=Streptomyces sp. NPDC014735 TaxID=3364887 RepID=UPI003702339B
MSHLRNHMISAIEASLGSGHRGGSVAVAVVCPAEAFADAPHWSPGADFTAVGGENPESRCWERHNADGTVTVVAAGVGPVPEVWTVTADPEDFDGCGLGNSMHGITWMRDVPGAVIDREPYAGHPAEDVSRYWNAFRQEWGVSPRGEEQAGAGWMFGSGKVWFYLDAHVEDTGALLQLVLDLCESFGATAQVHPYNPATKTYDGPDAHPDYVRRSAG